MNTFKVSYGASTDNGFTYAYYVEAIGQNDGRTFESDVIQLENKSGMESYSIVIDTNPTTIPEDTIETTGTSYTLKEKHFKKDLYLHVAAMDKAGNKSVSYFEIEKPELMIQASDSWTNGNVVSTIMRKGIGLERIMLPNGTVTTGTSVSYTAIENGTLTFTG